MTQKDHKMPIIAGVLLILAVMVAPAWAASVEPLVYPTVANAECSDICEYYGLGDCIQVLKLENDTGQVAEGDYSTSFGTITLSNISHKGSQPVSFDWQSEFGIWIVIVKDGVEGSNVYVYDPLATEDTYLTTPTKDDGTLKGISNIKFCIPVTNAPEFPTLAVPAAFLIGILGLVFVVRRKNE